VIVINVIHLAEGFVPQNYFLL